MKRSGPYLLLYLLVLAVTARYGIWYVNNPDSFQYLVIARKYLNGHFSEAVNGYWSPMISWLLLAPLALMKDGVLAFKLLQFIIGAFLIVQWNKLLDGQVRGGFYRVLPALAIVPFVAAHALLEPTADLLFSTVAVVLLRRILSGGMFRTPGAAVLTGLLGILLFLTKAFGLPLFTVVLLISALILQPGVRRSHLVLSAFVFITGCSLWALALSAKYGHFTYSLAATFNRTREVAPRPGVIMQLPVLSGGLQAPPDKFAISAWEAPGEGMHLHELEPWRSADDLRYSVRVVQRNVQSIWFYDFRRQTGMLFLVIAVLFLAMNGSWKELRKASFAWPLLFILLIYGGYSLILVHTRYTWICTWLMFFLSAKMLLVAEERHGLKRFFRLLMVLTVLLAVKRPVKELLFAKDEETGAAEFFGSLLHPFATLHDTYAADRALHAGAVTLRDAGMLKGNVASVENNSAKRHAYSSSLYLAFYSGAQYYGQLKEVNDPSVEKFRISEMLVWEVEKCDSLRLVAELPESDLRIYDLSDREK